MNQLNLIRQLQHFLLMFLFFNSIHGYSQNLVPNPNFESYYSCPDDISQLDSALNWITPTTGTSDYFNQCSTNPLIDVPDNFLGYQVAYSGNGYAGIYAFDMLLSIGLNYREYLEVALTSPLVNNSCYHFEMYLSLANTSAFSISNMSVYFSDVPVTNVPTYDPLPYTPQINNLTGQLSDTLNWVLFSANYTAHGGETHLLIGNFLDDNLTDTLLVNSSTSVERYAYYFIDDVSLTLCNSSGLSTQVVDDFKNAYPNPFDDKLTFKSNNMQPSEVTIYDVSSRIIIQSKFTSSVSINTESLSKGIYYYEIVNENSIIKKGKIIKK